MSAFASMIPLSQAAWRFVALPIFLDLDAIPAEIANVVDGVQGWVQISDEVNDEHQGFPTLIVGKLSV